MAFWDNIRFPYFNMQELNLDWIMNELKRIAGFMPQDGNAGDILTRKSYGASWEPPEAVNININALPEDTEIGDNDQLIFYDISAQANRKIKPPNLLDSMMSNGTPLMDGTASPGTSKKPARYDHRHPTDTTRAPASYFQNNALKIENGGTGATTAAGAVTALGLDAEMGANYIKFPWGLMMQFGNIVVDSGANTQIGTSGIYVYNHVITMPLQFINTQYVVFASSRAGTGYAVSSGCVASTQTDISTFNYDFYQRTYSASNSLVIEYCAIGRWK